MAAPAAAAKPEGFFPEIDPLNLDKEWILHASRVGKFASRQVEAKNAHAVAKAELEATEAELSEQVRANPERYGVAPGKAPSEPRIASLVTLQPQFRTALEAELKAKSKVDRYAAIMSTLEHHKQTLTDLTYLWGQSYFASKPKAAKGGGG